MNHLERSYTIAVVAILAALLGVLFVDMAGASEHSPNHPDYWGDDCAKDENFPYETDTWISDGDYVLVVLKAGQDRFVFENVTVGQVLTTGNGKAISHVIFCKEVPPSTTTTTQPTTTSTTRPTPPTSSVPPSSTTTTQPTTTTTTSTVSTTTPTTEPPTETTLTEPPSTTTTSTVSTTTTSSSVPPTTPTTEPHEDSPVLPDTGGGEQTLMFVAGLLSLIAGGGAVRWARR